MQSISAVLDSLKRTRGRKQVDARNLNVLHYLKFRHEKVFRARFHECILNLKRFKPNFTNPNLTVSKLKLCLSRFHETLIQDP